MTEEYEILSPYEIWQIWLNRMVHSGEHTGFYCIHYDPHRKGGSFISTRGVLNRTLSDYLIAEREGNLDSDQKERLFIGDVTHTRITKAATLNKTAGIIKRVSRNEYHYGYGLPRNWRLYFNPKKRALYMHINWEAVKEDEGVPSTQSVMRESALTTMVEAFERARAGSSSDWF